jgi:hypothetical protein
VLGLLAKLTQPLLTAPVKELKKALSRYQKDRDTGTFLATAEEVAGKYAPHQQAEGGLAPPLARRPRQREDLRLICYEFLS